MKKIPTLFERVYKNHCVCEILSNVTPGMEWVANVQKGEESNIQWTVKWSMEDAAWKVEGRNVVTGENYFEKVSLIPSHIFGPDAQDYDNINYTLDSIIVKLGGRSKFFNR